MDLTLSQDCPEPTQSEWTPNFSVGTLRALPRIQVLELKLSQKKKQVY